MSAWVVHGPVHPEGLVVRDEFSARREVSLLPPGHEAAPLNEVHQAGGVVTTWANGWGVWHVRVSRDAAAPLLGARRAIRDVLQARESRTSPVDRRCWTDLVEVTDLSTPASVVYREADPLTD